MTKFKYTKVKCPVHGRVWTGAHGRCLECGTRLTAMVDAYKHLAPALRPTEVIVKDKMCGNNVTVL